MIGRAQVIAESWQAYKRHQDNESKEDLLREYLPLVKRSVARIKPLLPDSVEESDLISYGLIGLLEAMERYDDSRNVPFEAYAMRRVRGSILDGMRTMGWLPRGAYQKAKQLQDVIANLEQRLGHAPSEEELAREFGMDSDAYAAFVMEAAPVSLLPFDELLVVAEQTEETQVVYETSQPSMAERVAAALPHLPERERLVVTLYFYEELTLKEIAALLEITEGRVCQLKTQALMRLRGRLRA